MNLSSIFQKPIDRPIEGVIKADDEAFLLLEVEEYVLTNEVAKRLDAFLHAYLNYEGANGVWISGFFGSGKSHLLKMLALLLEDRTIDGTRVLDLFTPKLANNTILRADLERAVAIPSRSILFNIDQKADVITKTQFDALLAVFVKVFDEMCGYYGKQGHIAQFERDLDSRDLYGPFKRAYQDVSGQPWEFGREQALLEGENIAVAYAQVTDTSRELALGILDKYRADYKVSIEDFADHVNAYILDQEPDFRLNFFVDEVGQYIADNVKLMTNLQTIAESLATKCRGRAWLVVTAQEDMTTVFGDTGRQQTDDFSKIQARFKVRMKLTSADVSEVIQKRLLSKDERGVDLLQTLYEREKNNLKTLFDFGDGSQSYRNFRDQDHFVRSYPFVPYQFVLFQSAIQSLSAHNAFEGKHRSVGERSMLGVFQQVAVEIAHHEVGQLATFDLMFEGIRTALKTQVQQSVLTAERNLNDPFAVRVLKALFLVKYVKEFKATGRNVTVLMIDRLNGDLPALRQRVEEALNLLEQQTYIQRNGEEYEYLTDEEKDIEEEIKQTQVETSDVADELGKLIFDNVIRDRKIRYDENNQDYPFSRKLDDRLLGREYELTIHVVSPFHPQANDETILRAQAMGRDELLVILPASERLMRDLLMYKRTEKYVMQNGTISQQESVRAILVNKRIQNQDRLQALRKLVPELMSKAKLIVDGRELDVNGGDPKTRIVRGFHELLTRSYPNLRMLRGLHYTEESISTCLHPAANLFGDDAATYSEAEQELLAIVQANSRNGLRITMQSLVSHFERKPYGWYLAAIQCTVAKLCARGKLEARRDATLLDERELERALRNTHQFANLVLEPQIEFTAVQVRQLKDFFGDFFDRPPQANEAKALGQETAVAFADLRDKLENLQSQAGRYPFVAALSEPLERLGEMAGRSYTYYLTELHRSEDELLDLKEQIFAPLQRFMVGPQREIYDRARSYIEQQDANFSYAAPDEARRLQEILDDPLCYRGNRMQQAKQLLDALYTAVQREVEEERSAALASAEQRWERLVQMDEYARLSAGRQAELRKPFDTLQRELQRHMLIAVIRDTLRRFDETGYTHLLRQMSAWARPPEPTPVEDGGPQVFREQTVDYVLLDSLPLAIHTAWLENEADVDPLFGGAARGALASHPRRQAGTTLARPLRARYPITR